MFGFFTALEPEPSKAPQSKTFWENPHQSPSTSKVVTFIAGTFNERPAEATRPNRLFAPGSIRPVGGKWWG
jgi:hypothetical protein